MIPVTPALKEAFNPNGGKGGRYIDYSLVWGVSNVEAEQNTTPAANEETLISRLSQLLNGNNEPLKIATFEPGGWPLDGSAVIPPRADELPDVEIGLIMPVLSDAGGYYPEPQELILTWPHKYGWIGFTVEFGHVPAADFIITYYEDTDVLHTTTVTGNTASTYVDMQGITQCNRVVLSITRCSLPHHRARVCEVLLGVQRRYNKSNSEGLQITESMDPLNERVPANELRISVDNFAADYNIFDPTGLYKYLQSRQQLAPRIGAQQANNQIGFVRMGTYYLQTPELKNNFTRLDLRATDLLGVLQDTYYTKGVYKTASLEHFLLDVSTDANVAVDYPAWFAGLTLATYIPTVSHAEAFRLIAQASNTVLYTNRDNKICFAEFSTEPLQTFAPADYTGTNGLQPSDDKIINTVEVAAVTWAMAALEEKLSEVTGSGVFSVKYEGSTNHGVVIDGGTLVSALYYADNAIIEITGGSATIYGHKLQKSAQTVSRTMALPNEQRLIYKLSGNPLIQSTNAGNVADHYLQLKVVKRRLVKMQYRGYPYIEMGDCVDYATSLFATQPFLVIKNALKLGGGMTGTLESRERL